MRRLAWRTFPYISWCTGTCVRRLMICFYPRSKPYMRRQNPVRFHRSYSLYFFDRMAFDHNTYFPPCSIVDISNCVLQTRKKNKIRGLGWRDTFVASQKLIWRNSPFIQNVRVSFESGSRVCATCVKLIVQSKSWRVDISMYDTQFYGKLYACSAFIDVCGSSLRYKWERCCAWVSCENSPTVPQEGLPPHSR